MKDAINIVINNEKRKIGRNTTLKELVKALELEMYVILARVNGTIMELNEPIVKDSSIEFITLKDKLGKETYKNGLKFLYIVSVKELYGDSSEVFIRHSLDKGLYTELNIGKEINEETVKEIRVKMKELAKEDIQINKLSALRKSAIEYYEDTNEPEKAKLLKQINNEYISMYEMLDYYNYFYSYMPISTEILSNFELTLVKPDGIVLRFPLDENIEVPKFTKRDKVLQVFKNYHENMNLLGVEYVGDINNAVSNGKIRDLIQINELIHNEKLSEIADEIINRKDKIKMVLISGPSSSGKTTTSKKLGLFLNKKGVKTFIISTDDYFKERKNTPKDENGNFDFEGISALDTKLFNNHIKKLLDSKSVGIPTYNFISGEKEYKKKPIKLEEGTVLIIEGLHAICDELTMSVKKDNKFKIYISPFTPLGIDKNNHISTLDLRLLRRMVRDNSHRGYNAERTLINWESVRRGEDKYIFPYQSEADIIYNTALIYEIGVLKTYAEPLLYSLEPNSPKYEEAMRLLNFLRCFFSIPENLVPNTSLLREFVGNSYFD